MDTSDGKNIPDANFYTGISSTILKTNILFAYKYNFIVLPEISIPVQYAWSAAFSFEETQTLLKQTGYPHGIRGLRCSLCFHSFK